MAAGLDQRRPRAPSDHGRVGTLHGRPEEAVHAAADVVDDVLAGDDLVGEGADALDLEGDGLADLVARLLKRPAYPLAWAKRVANRHVVDQLNRTLDAGAAYEMIGLAQLERQGWVDKTTLD